MRMQQAQDTTHVPVCINSTWYIRLSRELDFVHRFGSFACVFFFRRECLWVINVEAHAAHRRMASALVIMAWGVFRLQLLITKNSPISRV